MIGLAVVCGLPVGVGGVAGLGRETSQAREKPQAEIAERDRDETINECLVFLQRVAHRPPAQRRPVAYALARGISVKTLTESVN